MSVVSCQLSVVSSKSVPRTTDHGPQTWPRRALSLTEVLIAMGILTIGLLGVAAVFPVGSFYIMKAEIADRGSAIAQSVMNDIVANGMLNPRSWYVMVPSPRAPANGVWNTGFTPDATYSPMPTAVQGSFTRPFAVALSEALNQPTVPTDKTVLPRQFGSAYVIDPLGVSYMAFQGKPPNTGLVPGAVFPATAYYAFFYYANYPTAPTSAWAPWSNGQTKPGGYDWPVRRVTFRQPGTGWHLDPRMAEHFARVNDDLTVDLPARDDRPAIQDWEYSDTNKNGKPDSGEPAMARKWTGDYSWIATVVPSTNAARDAMATNPEGFTYDVSVVVFYKRVLPDSPEVLLNLSGNSQAYLNAMGANERAVQAKVISTGLNGGELLLSDMGDYIDPPPTTVKYNAFENLKTGRWIMICGPHPNSTMTEPRLVLNWYQVLTIEPVTAASNVYGYDPTKPGTQRLVALRGPQWPWQPTSDKAAPANNLCVAICRGAVAVHSKTMRLEGRSSSGTFGSGGTAGTTPPPYVAY